VAIAGTIAGTIVGITARTIAGVIAGIIAGIIAVQGPTPQVVQGERPLNRTIRSETRAHHAKVTTRIGRLCVAAAFNETPPV
jgi:hypothetical protein